MLAGTSWTLLLPAASYPEPDSVSIESGGRDFIFPHRIAADSAQAARTLTEYPMMDSLTIAMALEGLQATRLGLGPQTDVLAISLSTTDAVGHRYGPDSRELHDQILRLDRYLGVFVDSLYKLRDSSRIAVALTADHGVAPYPEVKSRDPNGGALHVDLQPLVRTTTDALRARGVDSSAFSFGDGAVYVDRDAFIAARVDADSTIRAFAAAARKVPGVLRADRVSALAADSARDPIARRWLHMFPPDASAALVITLRPYSYWGSVGYAEHGTPHDYDAHVPIIFYGPAFATGHYTTFARTVDMAPTLAAIANTMPAERLDGRVLREALKSGARAATRARR
jgi:predicted AlkP superfamily pyrophosphatase or phosphodiesterase